MSALNHSLLDRLLVEACQRWPCREVVLDASCVKTYSKFTTRNVYTVPWPRRQSPVIRSFSG